jgi:organic radical activating enzyme
MEISFDKFSNQKTTAKGSSRAWVEFEEYKTVWFNTGTLCNLSCDNCYIESSPTNDQLSYITTEEVIPFLEELKKDHTNTNNIGLTGGEPFLNPEIKPIITEILKRGFSLQVLTNAYRVLDTTNIRNFLHEIKSVYKEKFNLRISLDHYTITAHELERGTGTFEKTLSTIKWLSESKFNISIAGRSLVKEDMDVAIRGYQNLLYDNEIKLPLTPATLVIFPEMAARPETPEITTACWDILNVKPKDLMCSSERMIVKRKGDQKPVVQACTLLAYQDEFKMGQTLAESQSSVYLNHSFCSEFCVLGGASCSST